MQLQAVLSKAIKAINDIVKYLRGRRKKKLYQQWVERAGLPPEAIPQEEVAEDLIPKIDKEQLRLPILFMLLGASLVILCVGLVLLIAYAC